MHVFMSTTPIQRKILLLSGSEGEIGMSNIYDGDNAVHSNIIRYEMSKSTLRNFIFETNRVPKLNT